MNDKISGIHGASADEMRFLVGRDHARHWIVMETHGLHGGIFATRDAALRYAQSECEAMESTNGRHARCDLVNEPIELALPHGVDRQ